MSNNLLVEVRHQTGVKLNQMEFSVVELRIMFAFLGIVHIAQITLFADSFANKNDEFEGILSSNSFDFKITFKKTIANSRRNLWASINDHSIIYLKILL